MYSVNNFISISNVLQFFLNVFAEFSDTIFDITVKRLKPAT